MKCRSLAPWLFGAMLLVNLDFARAEDDDDNDTTKPGVMAQVESLTLPAGAAPSKVAWFEATPRLAVGEKQSPQYQIPPGAFKIRWTGLLVIQYPGQYTFTAQQIGLEQFTFTLGGQPITLGQPIELSAGPTPLSIAAQHAGGEANFELWWRSNLFADEPIEARFFRHQPADAESLPAAAHRQAERGAVLAETHGCFRCHNGPDAWTSLAAATPPGPKFEGLGSRVRGDWLVARLKNPSAAQHGARMPALFSDSPADDRDARVIAAYLTKDAVAPKEFKPNLGRGELVFKAAGCAACHGPAAGAADGALTSEAPLLEKLASKWSPTGLAAFLREPLKSRPVGRMPDCNLSDEEATDVAGYLLSLGGKIDPPAAKPLLTSEEIQTLYKQRNPQSKPLPDAESLAGLAVEQLNLRQCNRCHDAAPSPPAKAPPLANLDAPRAAQGCLAGDGAQGAAPKFKLADADRQALAAYVVSLQGPCGPSPSDRLRVDLALFNCVRCHDNEGQGGQSLAKLLGESEAAKHSLPPMLTRVAERVRGERLREFISLGARNQGLRPWVGARMPGFGPSGARVAEELAARDNVGVAPQKGPTAPVIGTPQLLPDLAQTGRTMVGAKSLACINCHTLHGKLLANQPDPTTRAPDLDKVAAHLRPEYFSAG